MFEGTSRVLSARGARPAARVTGAVTLLSPNKRRSQRPGLGELPAIHDPLWQARGAKTTGRGELTPSLPSRILGRATSPPASACLQGPRRPVALSGPYITGNRISSQSPLPVPGLKRSFCPRSLLDLRLRIPGLVSHDAPPA
ncbi:hypothetical protein SKAU_G00335910 [Synaphobranchus kaupii]|uniref:Uncharacterized protein n=1 Tax=Synaphobranchus kaupii TaxID=118154 RepID=A0A9Q1ELZ9_SYNKA|nr:hypothetical protein SKAU_G00335910 [Synaphobranchus kaupii]